MNNKLNESIELANRISQIKEDRNLTWLEIDEICKISKISVKHRHNMISDRVNEFARLDNESKVQYSSKIILNRIDFFKKILFALDQLNKKKKEEILAHNKNFFNQEIYILVFYLHHLNPLKRGVKTCILSFLDNKAYIHNKNFKISGEFLQLSQTMFKLRFEKEGLFLEFTGLKSTSEFFQTVGMNSVFDDRVSTGIGFISADYLHPNDLYDLKRIILENTGISEFNTLPSEKANVTKEKPFRHMLSVWKKHHYKNVSSQEIDGKYSSLYLKLMGESVPDNDNIISKIFGEGPNFYSNSMNRTLVDEVIRDNSEDKSIP